MSIAIAEFRTVVKYQNDAYIIKASRGRLSHVYDLIRSGDKDPIRCTENNRTGKYVMKKSDKQQSEKQL